MFSLLVSVAEMLIIILYTSFINYFLSFILSFINSSACASGTLWNLSSHEPLKMVVINLGLQTLTDEIIIPHSGWRKDSVEACKLLSAEWTTVFKNTSGCLRFGSAAVRRFFPSPGLTGAPPPSVPIL